LHVRGVVRGELHPGSIVVAETGDAALSPWPLAPRPQNWSGPGGFGTGPDDPRDLSARDDVRALGAVLLGALAGPPVLSSEQVGNLKRELAGRAPNAVTIADRALTPAARGGYAMAAELRDDCAAALAGRSVAVTASDPTADADAATVASARAETSEGRRAAAVLTASGAALLAGLGVAGSLGAAPQPSVRPVTTQSSACLVRPDLRHCAGPARTVGEVPAAQPVAAVPARFAENPVAPAQGSGVPRTVSTSTPATSTTATNPPASTTTSAPPSTTTSSIPSSGTTTSTTAAPATTTTAPPATTTSTSSNVVQAVPNGGSAAWSGQGLGPGPGPGH